MTRELFWLTLTVILTGLLWVPYILNRCQVRGLGGAMANPSRNDKPHAEWATRLMFAHDNAVENLVIFAPLVLILAADRLFHEMDRLRLRGVFLGPRRASDRLYDGPAGVPHAGLHRRLPRAGRAGAGDFQSALTCFQPFPVYGARLDCLTETARSAPAPWSRETRASGSCSGSPAPPNLSPDCRAPK